MPSRAWRYAAIALLLVSFSVDELAFSLILLFLFPLAAGDWLTGLARPQALACANSIARLHAAWWNGDRRDVCHSRAVPRR